MSAIRIRVRHPKGLATLSLPPTATVDDLRSEIASATALPVFKLKSGFPPQPLDLDQFAGDVALSDTGLALDGGQLIAEAKDIAAALSHPLGLSSPPPAPSEASPTAVTATPSLPPISNAAATTSSARTAKKGTDVAEDPPEVAVPSHSATLVLRVMPDDNSCLFRAVSAAVLGTGTAAAGDDGGADSMHELRSLVASTIAAQPDVYSAAILDKEPGKYCEWITGQNSWGGAIELGILATHFGVEIASVSVQDGRVDRFNEGAERRIILVYSGIHYDVVALSPSEAPHTRADLPAELDERVFGGDDAVVLAAARELCGELRKAHYFTDTASFGVVCNVAGCGWKGRGEKDAVEHAKGTGHYDFGET